MTDTYREKEIHKTQAAILDVFINDLHAALVE